MADLARPMLAEVLAALTGTSAGEWACDRRSFRIATSGASINMRPTVPWTTTDPAEAQETLVARGLLPEGWCDVAQRGWWCARCAKRCDRHTKTVPSTIPDLVAVASLGWPAIHRAETLARDACAALREYGCPQPERVAWRVGERGDGESVVFGHKNIIVRAVRARARVPKLYRLREDPMELKITPEDFLPGYRRLRNEAKERGDAASRNGDGYGAVYWGGIEEALAEFGDACDRLNARLATLTPEALAQEGGR